MNSIEKSKIYAEGKVIEALRQVVADAYMVGYNAGYQDGIDKIAEDSVLEETEFVDLGLPSGTLWASDYVKDGDEVLFLPYPEALKDDIPSEEQVNELGEYCKIIRMNDSAADKFIYMVLGPNGNSVTFEGYGYMDILEKCSSYLPFFWQIYNSDNPKEFHVPYFYSNGVLGTYCLFSGYRIPIRMVKTKL